MSTVTHLLTDLRSNRTEEACDGDVVGALHRLCGRHAGSMGSTPTTPDSYVIDVGRRLRSKTRGPRVWTSTGQRVRVEKVSTSRRTCTHRCHDHEGNTIHAGDCPNG